MGDVRRYALVRGSFSNMHQTSDGNYVLFNDYARLERERDELAEKLGTVQTDAYDARTEELAELTRLRAVEKAAHRAIDARSAQDDWSFPEAMNALTETCGRKG